MPREDPVAGELWEDIENNWLLFVTSVGHTKQGVVKTSFYIEEPWVWWENISLKRPDSSSIKWFIKNCRKVDNER